MLVTKNITCFALLLRNIFYEKLDFFISLSFFSMSSGQKNYRQNITKNGCDSKILTFLIIGIWELEILEMEEMFEELKVF